MMGLMVVGADERVIIVGLCARRRNRVGEFRSLAY
jgi:hypothetical protein